MIWCWVTIYTYPCPNTISRFKCENWTFAVPPPHWSTSSCRTLASSPGIEVGMNPKQNFSRKTLITKQFLANKIIDLDLPKGSNGSWRVSIHHPLGFNWHPLEGAGNNLFFFVRKMKILIFYTGLGYPISYNIKSQGINLCICLFKWLLKRALIDAVHVLVLKAPLFFVEEEKIYAIEIWFSNSPSWKSKVTLWLPI